MNGFAKRLLAWFDVHGRHDLPWQHPRTPYRVWIAEIMLQQTQVRTVIPYYRRFLERFPDLPDLAQAPLDDVLAAWSGLGYYSRARNLSRAARACVERHAGALPEEFAMLSALPGIGRSTAGAILAQACGQRLAILDGNVRRVLARHAAVQGDPGTQAVQGELWRLANGYLPQERLADYTQALMDLGATVCTRARPDCAACPLRQDCQALRQGRVGELPARRGRKARPLRHTVMLLARDEQGRVLLQRRAPIGVWAGLWSFPEGSDAQAAANGVGACIRAEQPGPKLRRAFTHYALDIHIVHAQVSGAGIVDADTAWLAPGAALRLGLPQPVRRLIESECAAAAAHATPANREGSPA